MAITNPFDYNGWMPGYQQETVPISHPAIPYIGGKRRSGRALVYSHRLLLWEMVGADDVKCHWCSTPLVWGKGTGQGVVLTDHIDGDRRNNDRSNLAAACARCNVMRNRDYRPTVAAEEPHVIGDRGNRIRANEHICKWCGIAFLAERARPNPTFCSLSCVGKSSAHSRWHGGD